MACSGDRLTRRVLVVDDQRAFAESLEVVLGARDEVESVDAVATGEDAVTFVRDHDPDVVVMDVDLPGMNGIEAIEQLSGERPDLTIVVLTGYPDAAVFARAASAGAHAFLLKDSSLDEILDAVLHTSPLGEIQVDSSSVREIVEARNHRSPDFADDITPRELEVLGLLSEGRQPKEIARTLDISVHTCRDHVKQLLSKLGAHSALEAVVIANRSGLISLPTD